jgi:hypothetical protein
MGGSNFESLNASDESQERSRYRRNKKGRRNVEIV